MKKGIVNFFAFVALVIIAFLLCITRLLPILGVNISGPIINLIATVQNVLILFIVGILAYNFAMGKRKWVKILFWCSVIVYIAGSILLWIK